MANVMNQKDVKNHVHRSGFDLSARRLFTSATGEIVPVAWYPVLPGDKFTINMSEFLRTVPFQTANFGRLRHYVDAYFVPYRLLWDKFPGWIAQTKTQYYAKSITQSADQFSSQPYLTHWDIMQYLEQLARLTGSDTSYTYDDAGMNRVGSSCKLLEYLGLGFTAEFTAPNPGAEKVIYPKMPNVGFSVRPPLNLFPLLAYQKIYQDYFRNPQWENAAPWTYNLDYVLNENQLHLSLPSTFYTSSNMFDMRYCNYDKDLLNGLVPTTQYGDEAIASPIMGNLTGNLQVSIPNAPDGYNSILHLESLSGGKKTIANNGAALVTTENIATLNLNNSNGSAGLSILSLRYAEALQKWREITLTGNQDYRSQLLKHWNVSISDYASDMCEYLGGMSNNIDIAEVTNMNLTEGNDADLKGKGAMSQTGHVKFSAKDDDYGVIMIVSHVKPIIEWNAATVLNPVLFHHLNTDYPIPEFDSLGMQPYYNIYFNGVKPEINQESDVFPVGYAPRYYEYKTNMDTFCGGFRSMPQWILPHNVPYTWTGYLDNTWIRPRITASFFRVTPKITQTIFDRVPNGLPESDCYYHSVYLDVKVARNLSYDGLPY